MSSLAVPARPRSAAALLLAGVLWGTGGLSGALLGAGAHLAPLAVAAYRLLVGGCLGTLYLGWRGVLWRVPRTRAVLRRVLVIGFLFAAFQASYFAAVSLGSVSVATMTTIGCSPVVVTAVTALRARRLPAPPALAAIAVALAGLVLLCWSPTGLPAGWRLACCLACALLAGAGFATMTLVSARPVAGLDGLSTTAFSALTGGLLLLPAALPLGMALPPRLGVFAAALYLGAVPTALAYAAYLRGLTVSHPMLAALSALLEPLTAAALAALVLGDRLGVTGWSGAALLVTALALSHLRRPG